LRGAKKGRKFDEVKALQESKGELEREIDGLNGVLGQLDWRGVYGANGGGGAGGSGGVVGSIGGALGFGNGK